jgi:diaminohydroxyphosphoribosylaminopyrimidine deaminase / 5-amino-6-(5-phosphoribosylamino)uracil reductase
MACALALAQRGAGRTGTNPNVGCIIVKQGRVIGRGWTQPGGRPHAEAMALAQANAEAGAGAGAEAGTGAAGAEVYVTLEPCAHISPRGPSCADLLISARLGRVVAAITDPDPRTAGQGMARLAEAGILTQVDVMPSEAAQCIQGFIMRHAHGRPFVTLKLATSLDGAIAMADGSSRWITGEAARAHTHIKRMRSDAILVGAGTMRADTPSLDVRLAGLEKYSPIRVMLGRGKAPSGWQSICAPEDISTLECNNLLVEGGAQTAASFLRAGLVDRLILYRAPILIGAGKPCLTDIGLKQLSDAHDKWQLQDSRMLGMDRMEIYYPRNGPRP